MPVYGTLPITERVFKDPFVEVPRAVLFHATATHSYYSGTRLKVCPQI